MALTKRTYVGGTTKITADNLNEIQDSIISLENETLNKTDITDALGYTPAKPNDIPTEDITANTTARHTHSNKTFLDNISGITSVSDGIISGTDNSLATKKALDTMKTQIKSDFPTSLKNPKTLTFTGAVSGTYDGSTDLTVNIPSGGSGTGGQGQDGKSVNWRGEYGASTTYNKLDAVSYNGSSYIYSSSTSASGKVPGVDSEWDLMAEKGEDGSPGVDGKDGKDGTNGTNGSDGSPGIIIGSTQPTGDTHPVWLDPDGDASVENPLNLTSATVGQIAKISAVDDNGVPTAWEPVDMPSGGEEKVWTKVVNFTSEEDMVSATFTEDSEGSALEFDEALIYVSSARASGATTNGSYVIGLTSWASSYNSKGMICSLPLFADMYTVGLYVFHIGNIAVAIPADKWRSGTSIADAKSVENLLSQNLGHAPTSAGNPKTLISSAGEALITNNKFHTITVGIDMNTAIQMSAGTIIEVFAR